MIFGPARSIVIKSTGGNDGLAAAAGQMGSALNGVCRARLLEAVKAKAKGVPSRMYKGEGWPPSRVPQSGGFGEECERQTNRRAGGFGEIRGGSGEAGQR
jgi:hypothetical protein